MEAPADIYSLAKQALRVLVQRQPVYFTHSASLFDDLRSAHSQRRQIPIVYEALLREARDSGVEYLTVCAKCRTLQLAAIHAAPKLLGICFWREAPEAVVGPDRRAGKGG